ncbi:MAG: hypothetical protein ACYCU0_05120, partial [Solirubrobacteraceae bacterium]
PIPPEAPVTSALAWRTSIRIECYASRRPHVAAGSGRAQDGKAASIPEMRTARGLRPHPALAPEGLIRSDLNQPVLKRV